MRAPDTRGVTLHCRPLGFHLDAAGNLVICDSLKVGASACAAHE